jgi:hypothetical protein
MPLSSSNRIAVVLSAQRALTYNIPRAARAIYIRADESEGTITDVHFLAYLDREPTDEDTEPLRVAVSEILADFPSSRCTREEYASHPANGFTRATGDWICVFALADDGVGNQFDVA